MKKLTKPTQLLNETEIRIPICNLISQAEAARMRGVSRAAIFNLIKRGRLAVYEVGGHKLLNYDEVVTLKPQKTGKKASASKV